MRQFIRSTAALMTLTLLACTSSRPIGERDIASSRSETPGGRAILDASGYLYDPNDRSCDGYPRLHVETMPGTCLGMVLPKSRAVDKVTGKALPMPRTIVELRDAPDEFLLVDMGGWKPNNGGIFHLRKHGSFYETVGVRLGLNMPHGLTYGPGGFIYVAETDKISRFHFTAGKVVDWQIVVADIPRPKGYMHPLTQIAFDPTTDDMYVNAGAPSDHCYSKDVNPKSPDDVITECPETFLQGLGSILMYPGAAFKNLPPGGIPVNTVVATGLRNSMALVVSSKHYVIQGENGRDFPELEEPYEEINVIDPYRDAGVTEHHLRFYGWPQCYNFRATSPEWALKDNDPKGMKKRFQTFDCEKPRSRDFWYKAPWALIPPHAAPLHAAYYNGAMFADTFAGSLLMTWHGYQPTGHRLVAYKVDQFGRPVEKAADDQATFFFDQKNRCPVVKKFTPRGGFRQYAPYTEVISGWDERKGFRPKGAPVSFTVAHDGSIFIVEDRDNHTVLRLAKDPGGNGGATDCKKNDSEASDPRMELLAWRSAILNNPNLLESYEAIRKRLITPYCIGCHGAFKSADISSEDRFSNLDFLVSGEYFIPGKPTQSKIVGAVSQAGTTAPMPPGGSLQLLDKPEAADIQRILSDWIGKLPTDVDKTVVRINIGSSRTIRNGPGAAATACGQLPDGAPVYVDPRAELRVRKDGWIWTRIYMVPGDSNLFQGKCAYPEDGVFWMAVKKG